MTHEVFKWAVERRAFNGGDQPDTLVRLGTVTRVGYGGGYRFTSNVASHGNSRKLHKTFAQACPRWVGYPDGCETREL